MKRLIFALCMLFSGLAGAQTYYQYVGPGLVYSHYQQELEFVEGNVPAGTLRYNSIIYGFSYGGKILVNKRPNFSYGVGAYPFGGVYLASFSNNVFGNIGVNLPVYGEVMLGNPESYNMFLGLGFEYNFYKEFGYNMEHVIGPSVELGGQIDLPNRIIAVKLAYTYGLNKGRYDDPSLRVVSGRRGSFTATLYYPF